MDVFFCGFGCWNGVISNSGSILSYHRLTDIYQVNRGAFSLRKKDELACNYNETARFDGIQYLQPSARPDDEFRKAQIDKVLVLDKAYGKYKGYIFSIDASRQAELVIAEPDKPAQTEALKNVESKKSSGKIFDKRLEALIEWLEVSLNYSLEMDKLNYLNTTLIKLYFVNCVWNIPCCLVLLS